MNLHSIFSYHPLPRPSLHFFVFFVALLGVNSVLVFLPDSLPKAVLIKALNIIIGRMMEGHSDGLLSEGGTHPV